MTTICSSMSSCVVSSWWRHGQFGEPNDVIGYPNAFLCGKIQSFHGGCAWDILQMLVKAERSNIESWNWSWEIQQEPDKLSCTRVEQSSEKAQGRRVEGVAWKWHSEEEQPSILVTPHQGSVGIVWLCPIQVRGMDVSRWLRSGHCPCHPHTSTVPLPAIKRRDAWLYCYY